MPKEVGLRRKTQKIQLWEKQMQIVEEKLGLNVFDQGSYGEKMNDIDGAIK